MTGGIDGSQRGIPREQVDQNINDAITEKQEGDVPQDDVAPISREDIIEFIYDMTKPDITSPDQTKTQDFEEVSMSDFIGKIVAALRLVADEVADEIKVGGDINEKTFNTSKETNKEIATTVLRQVENVRDYYSDQADLRGERKKEAEKQAWITCGVIVAVGILAIAAGAVSGGVLGVAVIALAVTFMTTGIISAVITAQLNMGMYESGGSEVEGLSEAEAESKAETMAWWAAGLAAVSALCLVAIVSLLTSGSGTALALSAATAPAGAFGTSLVASGPVLDGMLERAYCNEHNVEKEELTADEKKDMAKYVKTWRIIITAASLLLSLVGYGGILKAMKGISTAANAAKGAKQIVGLTSVQTAGGIVQGLSSAWSNWTQADILKSVAKTTKERGDILSLLVALKALLNLLNDGYQSGVEEIGKIQESMKMRNMNRDVLFSVAEKNTNAAVQG
ncbi:MAG: hypothetical protein HN411_06585 [Waddliaceae bacterium]|jgi:hypothetical protein|nr:hypothetical protein [Waddliaceae bacterium]MBT3578452.1 hypothetical protein [Waddliaceae bacterium]MBT4445077.1 hypothetical protein [Waddliaceae bacterium]MBT7264822.1 hypothetical protein [Waddliaceae bacterium]MBT7462023.1 hypothetical protein [Waddliaceae bacterium]